MHMKKINIVRDSKDFENAIKKGNRTSNTNYIIYVISNEREYYRFGISVGKKISNRAVIRNKLKRQLKSIIDNHKNLYQNHQDYIIIMKRNCLESNYEELENSFLNIMNKISK